MVPPARPRRVGPTLHAEARGRDHICQFGPAVVVDMVVDARRTCLRLGEVADTRVVLRQPAPLGRIGSAEVEPTSLGQQPRDFPESGNGVEVEVLQDFGEQDDIEVSAQRGVSSSMLLCAKVSPCCWTRAELR